MLAAILEARRSIQLETYIFQASPLGDRFRQALVEAARRGVQVRVLVDAFGSLGLEDSYWHPLNAAGGEFRWFNPVRHRGSRDHRKLLVVDERLAIIGGCNLAPEYYGDGVGHGWRDLGLKCHSELLAAEFGRAFAAMFSQALSWPWRPRFLRRATNQVIQAGEGWKLLLSGPGWGHRLLRHTLAGDLAQAKSISIIAPYFLPTWGLRREIVRAARRGRAVRLILAGRSDVRLAQLANRHQYQRLLHAGVQIFEYQPQILHAKLLVLDDIVYAGSANLDIRSLTLNYELLLRLQQPELAAEARGLFAEDLTRCRRISAAEWRRSRSFLERLLETGAFFLLTKADPYLARRWLRD